MPQHALVEHGEPPTLYFRPMTEPRARFLVVVVLALSACSSGSSARPSIDAAVALPDAGPPVGERFPLRISPSRRYLVDRNDRPFLLRGDTPWALIVEPTTAGAIAYLDDRRARGFNTIMVNVIDHGSGGHTPPWRNAAGDLPFTDNHDFTTTVDGYFDHAEQVVQEARARGFLVLLVPAYLGYGCGNEGWCADMKANGVGKLRAYGQYLGTRFKNYPNIVWVQGGDRTPDTAGTPSERDLVEAVVQGIRIGDGDVHLHTAHWSSGTAGSDVATTWLDIDSLYTYTSPHVYVAALALNGRDSGVRPLFLIESSYENEHQTTRLQLRAQMYQPVLSGGAGFLFGNFPVWALWVPGNPPWKFDDGGYPGGWATALDTPGARSAKIATDLLETNRWWELRPDTAHTVMTSGFGTSGSNDYALAASTADGRLAVAYYTARLSPSVNLGQFAGPVRARWVDPSSGTATTIAGSPFTNSGSQIFTPPAGGNGDGSNDWLLILDVQ